MYLFFEFFWSGPRAAILDSWDILASSEGERARERETPRENLAGHLARKGGGAQDVTHAPNPVFNSTELPPLKLSLVGVWHNIKTRRRLQWQVYSLGNSCVNKGKLL